MATKKSSFVLLGILVISAWVLGSAIQAGADLFDALIKAKEQMDLQATTETPLDVVWEAAQDAVQELGIVVGGKKFSENKGEIGGHIGQLDYIRVYVWQWVPGSTKIGIQARTALLPKTSKGYDHAYATKIMNTILGKLRSARNTPKADTSFTSTNKAEPQRTLGAPIEIAKYLSPVGQTATYQYQINLASRERKQASGRVVIKTLEKRAFNDKQVVPYRSELSDYSTGKNSSSLNYFVLDETGYYRYAEQTEEMVEPKVLSSPKYQFKAPFALNASWEEEGNTLLMRTRVSGTFVVVVEKIDDVVTVSAGSFENCLRLKSSCEVTNSKNQKVEVKVFNWFAPGVGWVKTIREERSSDPTLGDGGTMTWQLSSIQK
jgi:hypothetical protein